MFLYQCEVRGCKQDSIVGVFHKLYGKGDYCSGHNPIPHDYTKLITGLPRLTPLAVVEDSQQSAGSRLSQEELITQMLRELIRLVMDGDSNAR